MRALGPNQLIDVGQLLRSSRAKGQTRGIAPARSAKWMRTIRRLAVRRPLLRPKKVYDRHNDGRFYASMDAPSKPKGTNVDYQVRLVRFGVNFNWPVDL